MKLLKIIKSQFGFIAGEIIAFENGFADKLISKGNAIEILENEIKTVETTETEKPIEISKETKKERKTKSK